jgi:hypothetical protein
MAETPRIIALRISDHLRVPGAQPISQFVLSDVDHRAGHMSSTESVESMEALPGWVVVVRKGDKGTIMVPESRIEFATLEAK